MRREKAQSSKKIARGSTRPNKIILIKGALVKLVQNTLLTNAQIECLLTIKIMTPVPEHMLKGRKQVTSYLK